MSLEIVPNAGCSSYVDEDTGSPCKCPVCGGFLKWDNNGEPICNKCCVELVLVPEVDEDTKEPLEWGKICAVGKPQPKPVQHGNLKLKRQEKANYKKWKAFL
jgi:hypothetical protein